MASPRDHDFFFLATLNLNTAGLGSRLPAASIAVTVNLCLPGFSFFTFAGLVHGVAGFLSRAHSNEEPGPDEEKLNFAFFFVDFFFGPLPAIVSGAAVSAGGAGGVGGVGGADSDRLERRSRTGPAVVA